MIENLRQEFQPVINTGLVCPDARWYAVQTAPRHEKKVSSELVAKDIDCFLPTVSKLRQWSDRKQMIVEPLFAGYMFARLVTDSSARIALLRTSGVVGLVGVRGVGIPIPDTEINSIHKILEARTPFASHPFIKVGKRVRVRGGSLDGLEGLLQSVNGDESLVVSVELIQRSLAMTISGYTVEPVLQSNETVPVARAVRR
jgi:transcription antitermination factor NusG